MSSEKKENLSLPKGHSSNDPEKFSRPYRYDPNQFRAGQKQEKASEGNSSIGPALLFSVVIVVFGFGFMAWWMYFRPSATDVGEPPIEVVMPPLIEVVMPSIIAAPPTIKAVDPASVPSQPVRPAY